MNKKILVVHPTGNQNFRAVARRYKWTSNMTVMAVLLFHFNLIFEKNLKVNNA